MVNLRKRTTRTEVLKNLKELIGEPFSYEKIIIAFSNFEEEGETSVIVKQSENIGYDYIAYINSESSTQFLFEVEKGIIKDVWISY